MWVSHDAAHAAMSMELLQEGPHMQVYSATGDCRSGDTGLEVLGRSPGRRRDPSNHTISAGQGRNFAQPAPRRTGSQTRSWPGAFPGPGPLLLRAIDDCRSRGGADDGGSRYGAERRPAWVPLILSHSQDGTYLVPSSRSAQLKAVFRFSTGRFLGHAVGLVLASFGSNRKPPPPSSPLLASTLCPWRTRPAGGGPFAWALRSRVRTAPWDK